jgi:HD-GYP domain-containing protein (c-di-GMP phosphodiesterase class II)
MTQEAAAPRSLAASPFGDDSSAVIFLISIAVSATSVALALTARGAWSHISARPAMFATFLALTLALQLVSVEVYGRGTFSFAGSGLLAIGFTFGVGAAMAAALLAAALNFGRHGGKLHRALFTAATWCLAAAIGSLPYAFVDFSAHSELVQLVVSLGAGPLYLLVNLGLLSCAMAFAEGSGALAIWRERFRWMTPYYLASGPLGAALVIAYEKLGLAGLGAFALPPAFMMISAKQYLRKTRSSVEETRQKNLELEQANDELATRNADLQALFQLAGGLAARAHDRAALVGYAEETLGRITGGTARIRVGPGSGGSPLLTGGSQVGSLSLLEDGDFDRRRWERLREAILPQLATAIESVELGDQIRKTHLATIAALSRAIEAKDYYTGGHTERVAAIAVALAKRLGFTGSDLDAIEIGGLLHDVGKIGIPERILQKPGRLDAEEMKAMQEHPIISDYILSGVDLPLLVRQIARSSHERIDGDGYPDNLAGEAIPLAARIVFVADAFDALTSDRPYRAGRHVAAALEELRRNAGTQFCSRVIDALESVNVEEPELLAKQTLRAVEVA